MPLFIPVQINQQTYVAYILLDELSVVRIQKYDPLGVGFPENFKNLKLVSVKVGFANQDDQQEILRLTNAGDIKGMIKYIERGWEFRPDLGDHDGPMTTLEKKADDRQ